MAEESKLTLDISQALAELDAYGKRVEKLEGEYEALSNAAKKAGTATKTSLVSNGDAARTAIAEINALQSEYKQTEQAVATLRTALKTAYDPRAIATYTKALNGGLIAMIKMERAADGLGVNLKAANKEASTGQQVFEGLFGAITKATVILAVLSKVKELAGQALDLADNYKKAQLSFAAFLGSAERADQVLASLNKTAQENFLPVADVQAAGKALLAFGEEADNLPAVLTRVANISAATGKNFNELATIYGKARTQGVLFAEDLNQLTDAGIPIIQQFAKQMGVSAGSVKKLASEGKIGFAELELAFAQLTAKGSAFAGQAEAAASSSNKLSAAFDTLLTTIGTAIKPAVDSFKSGLADIASALDQLIKSNSLEQFGDRFITFFERVNPIVGDIGKIIRQALGLQTEGEQGIEPDIRKQRQLEAQAFSDQEDLFANAEKERKRLAEQSAKSKAAEAEKARKAREAALREQEAYNQKLLQLSLERLDPESEARAIAQENLRFATLTKEFKKFGLDTEDIEAQHVLALYNIRQDFYQKRLDQQHKAEADELADLENFLADRRDAFEADKTNNDASIDVFEEQSKRFILQLKAQGASEDEIRFQETQLRLLSQRARLQNELDFQENLLKITDAGNTDQLKIVKNAIALVKEQIATINFQIENPDTKGKAGSFSIWKSLGIDPNSDEGKLAIDSFRQSADTFKSILSDLAAARVAEAQAAVDSANQKVQAAEDALKKEQDLQEQGFAANITAAENALNTAKAQRERAIIEQRKAQQAQLALDAAQQASNIALSITNLVKSWSELPFGIGLLAAAAQAASIIALITSVRTKARALSAPPQFRHGGEASVTPEGILVGPSHEGGGIGINAEGGEFATSDGRRLAIVNKKATAKHFDLLAAINRDDRRAIFRYSMALSGGSQMEVDRKGITKRLFGTSPGATSDTGDKHLSRLVEVQERMLRLMIEERSEKETWSPDGKVKRAGNTTTRYLNG